MANFFFILKKPIFGPISLILGAKKVLKKQVVMHNFIRVLAPWQSPEKSNDEIPRKQMSGGKDGQILFYTILPPTARV